MLDFSQYKKSAAMEKATNFIRRAENLFELGKFTRAQGVVEEGLEKFPESTLLAKFKNDIFYTSKDFDSVPFKYHAWHTRMKPGIFKFKSGESTKTSKGNIQPIQYWSQGNTPVDVKTTTDQWNRILDSLGLAQIELFEKISAREWIKEHCPDFLISFDTAFHYASEADVFRAAYASLNECVWIDSDFQPAENAHLTMQQALASDYSFFFWYPTRSRINNAFFIARHNCKFFKSLISETKGMDLSAYPQNTHTIIATFGAGRYNSILTNMFLNSDRSKLEQGAETPIQKICFDEDSIQLCDRGFIRSENFNYDYKNTRDYWAKGIFN